ncbi:cupin domain-containing protein [Legionella anisa]|uniref:cupin domain-containing protein n=1 Tax=Legionella anisa TaxID=28082 RepID=UPI001041A1BB|nr:cupin domain-containing protein [Legionella anisa]
MEVQIIKKEQIEAITSITCNNVTHNLGEVRDFRKNTLLKEFLEGAQRCSISWVKLKENETLERHVHDTKSMIILTQGSCAFLGKFDRELFAGDVIIVPSGQEHGFSACLGQSMEGLSIQFEGEGLYEDIKNPRVIFQADLKNKLLDKNNERILKFQQSQIIQFIRSGGLNDPTITSKFYSAFKVWCSYFQKLIFARQATTFNKIFYDLFLEHLKEEIGHNDLIEANMACYDKDSIITAGSHWFLNKMMMGSDVEKLVVMHLCIEASADVLHNDLKKFNTTLDVNKDYVNCHANHDHTHANMGTDLLDNISAFDVSQLSELLDDSWNMLELILNRVAYLANN